ncbi:MAG: DnaJ domain [Bacteroidota bacterium]|jgi:Fe-S protein assembly co-chaperone HscB
MNAFECLGLVPDFCLDNKALRSAFIQSQRAHHPDHNPSGSDISEQSNRAFELLKDELTRARHLLELQQIDERNFPLSAADLMAWMELGEELEAGTQESEIELLFAEREHQLAAWKEQMAGFQGFPYQAEENALMAQWIQGESYRRRLRKIQRGEQEI